MLGLLFKVCLSKMKRFTALFSMFLVLYGDTVFSLGVPSNPFGAKSASTTSILIGAAAGAALVASGVGVLTSAGLVAVDSSLFGSLSAAGAVHGGIVGFEITKNPDSSSTSLGGSSSSSTGSLAVVLASPNTPVPSSAVPAGWQAGVGAAAPVPPILVSGTPAQNCPAGSVETSWYSTPQYPVFNGYGYCLSNSSIVGLWRRSSCPAGYIQSGFTGTTPNCSLNDPVQVKKPTGSAEVIKPVASTTPVSRDPQINTSDRINGLTVSNNKVSFTDPDSGDSISADYDTTGQITKLTVSIPSTSAKSAVGASASSGASQSSTSVDTVNFSTDSSGQAVVTGTSHQTFSGTGTSQSSTPIQQVEPIGVGSGSGGSGSGSQTCQNCALESTQQQVLVAHNQTNSKLDTVNTKIDSTNSKLDRLHTDLTDPSASAAPSDPSVPNTSQFDDSFFHGTFNSLTGWRLPAHSSQCPVAVFDYDLFGSHQHLVLDAHCTIIESVRNVLSSSMIVVYTLTALFIVLGA